MEKFERELKNKVEELKEMAKVVERLQQSEKEFIESRSAIEIARKKEENLIEELKKTKDKQSDLVKTNEDLTRNLQDLQIKLKESELLLTSKEAKIQELELKASRVTADQIGLDFQDGLADKVEDNKPNIKTPEQRSQAEDEEIAARFQQMREEMEKQISSNSEQIKRTTDKNEELRRENTSLKKETDILRQQLQESSSQLTKTQQQLGELQSQSANRAAAPNPDDWMQEILQKSLEVETQMRTYKQKSEELSKKVLSDLDFYRQNLAVLYAVAVDRPDTTGGL